MPFLPSCEKGKSLQVFGSALLLALCTLSLSSLAQSLPPTPTTQPPISATQPRLPPQPPTHRATIAFTAGQLLITADNSSLNQILRDIARLTGMTITGGVADERVFGTYGPADTSTVLSALLNGTGSNMLLLQNSSQSPQQLVLTPRQGGPTPPSPNAAPRVAGATPAPPPAPAPPRSRQPPPPATPTNLNGALPSAPPAEPLPQPALAPTPDTSAPSPTPPPADTTTQQSPNGIKTPQQIYDQLMQLQQQQAKPPQ